jgi:hypothetical protein
MLEIKCKFHPKYQAVTRPRVHCGGCEMLFILRWQHTSRADEKLGSVNPYQELADLEACLELLEAE